MKRILMAIVTAILMGSAVPVLGTMVSALLPVSHGSAAYAGRPQRPSFRPERFVLPAIFHGSPAFAARNGGGIPGFPVNPCKCG